MKQFIISSLYVVKSKSKCWSGATGAWKAVLQVKNIFSSGCIMFILNKDQIFKNTDSETKYKSFINQKASLKLCGYSEDLHPFAKQVCRMCVQSKSKKCASGPQ